MSEASITGGMACPSLSFGLAMLAYQEASADVGMATANDAEAMPPATEALHPAPPLPVGLIMYVMLRSASGGAAGPGKPRNPEPGKTANPGATDTRRCFLRVRAAPARKDGCHGHAPLLFACPCRAGQDPTDRVPPVRANLRTGARPHPGGEGRGRLSWSRHRLHGHANNNSACPWHPGEGLATACTDTRRTDARVRGTQFARVRGTPFWRVKAVAVVVPKSLHYENRPIG